MDTSRALNVALLGHGKMGKLIAQLAAQRGMQVQQILRSETNCEGVGITKRSFQGIDVCLDFTTPAAVVENIRRVAGCGCHLVVGTTGWYERLDEVREIIERAGVGMVYAPNFSLGVQLFYRVARAAAEIFSGFPTFEPYLTETHHQFKKDAPSGTALELKREVEPYLRDHALPISSVRAGYFPGMHEFGFDSEVETLLVRHTVRTRQVFAEGALYAARWVAGRKGLYRFADILQVEEVA